MTNEKQCDGVENALRKAIADDNNTLQEFLLSIPKELWGEPAKAAEIMEAIQQYIANVTRPGKCSFYLKRKHRYCAHSALHGRYGGGGVVQRACV